MKLFIYNKHLAFGVELSLKNEMLAKQELLNRERPEDEKTQWIESENFPPVGKFFEVGVGLRDKTEKEKVEAGEIKLSDIKEQIFQKINKRCYDAIVSGFESKALGTITDGDYDIYVYDSEDVDQMNLIGAVAIDSDVAYKCTRKSDMKREFFKHTNAQIKQVLSDAANRKISLLKHCYELKASIQALNNYDAVISFDILQGWE